MFYRKHKRVQLKFSKPSRTKQAEADAADINKIMAKYQKTGILPHLNNRVPTYGDFSEVTDYQDALNTVMRAEAAFMALPSSVRAKFDNDPARFLDFTQDPANLDALREMGLAPPAPPVQVAPEPAPAPAPAKPTA